MRGMRLLVTRLSPLYTGKFTELIFSGVFLGRMESFRGLEQRYSKVVTFSVNIADFQSNLRVYTVSKGDMSSSSSDLGNDGLKQCLRVWPEFS